MSSVRSVIDLPFTAARSSTPGAVRRRASGALVAAALLFTACGSSDDTVSSDAAVDVEQSEDVQDADVTPADDESADAVEASPAALQENGPIDVVGAPLATYDDPADAAVVGTAAPVVSGESFDGTEIVLGAPTDNPTLVVFLAHWCPHCNDEVPELIALEEAGRIPDGLDVVGVSTAVVADRDNYPPSQWIEDKGWPWPTMADDEIQSAITAFGGSAFPFAVVLDADGTVLARRAGQATGDETVAFLESALANAGS